MLIFNFINSNCWFERRYFVIISLNKVVGRFSLLDNKNLSTSIFYRFIFNFDKKQSSSLAFYTMIAYCVIIITNLISYPIELVIKASYTKENNHRTLILFNGKRTFLKMPKTQCRSAVVVSPSSN